ncbi:MAG: hypothetical protein WBA93_06495 [Microcoleaceae cyanobacterium]
MDEFIFVPYGFNIHARHKQCKFGRRGLNLHQPKSSVRRPTDGSST